MALAVTEQGYSMDGADYAFYVGMKPIVMDASLSSSSTRNKNTDKSHHIRNEEYRMEKNPNSNGRWADSATCSDNQTIGLPKSTYRENVQRKATRLYAWGLFRYMYGYYYYDGLTTISKANEARL